LRKLRLEIGLTQKELAELLQIPQGTIATWERRGDLSGAGNYIYKDLLSKTEILRAERKSFFLDRPTMLEGYDRSSSSAGEDTPVVFPAGAVLFYIKAVRTSPTQRSEQKKTDICLAFSIANDPERSALRHFCQDSKRFLRYFMT
jgi:Helix-turn-helix